MSFISVDKSENSFIRLDQMSDIKPAGLMDPGGSDSVYYHIPQISHVNLYTHIHYKSQ